MNKQRYQSMHHFTNLLILLIYCLLSTAHAKPTSTDNIVINFKLVSEKVSLNEPVLVDLLINNQSTETLSFKFGPNSIELIEFSINSPDNKSFERYKFTPAWGASTVRSHQLEPGETYQDTLIINKWFSIDSPGLYKIKPHVVAPMTSTGQSQSVVAQLMLLQVTPRNEKRLKRRVNELLASALTDKRASLTNTAEILSYLNDPVAIDALEHLLLGKSGTKQYFAAQGLARIANLQSINVLIKYQRKFEQTGNYFISRALHKIAKDSADPEVAAVAHSAYMKYKNRPVN